LGAGHRGRGDRPAGGDRVQDLVQPGQRGLRLDQQLDRAAAGETDLERVVVAHSVRLGLRLSGLDHLAGGLVDRALDAAAGDAAQHLAGGRDGHRRARLPGRRTPSAHDGGHRERHALGAPGPQAVGDVPHTRTIRARRRQRNAELSDRLGAC
jgi:hypothetical protein